MWLLEHDGFYDTVIMWFATLDHILIAAFVAAFAGSASVLSSHHLGVGFCDARSAYVLTATAVLCLRNVDTCNRWYAGVYITACRTRHAVL